MKHGACLSYSHGFNIVEEGMQVRDDITVIMVAPKCPGTEVREEYLRGFGVPTLIAVHRENDPNGEGFDLAKAYAAGTGGHRAGVLESSFIAEVKSDLMGEQTILCGMLQTGSILCFDRMVELGIEAGYAAKLVQNGWETVTEGLKHGGITNMMDRLTNPAKIRAYDLAEDSHLNQSALRQPMTSTRRSRNLGILMHTYRHGHHRGFQVLNGTVCIYDESGQQNCSPET